MDYILNKTNALALAEKIKEWWATQGRDVHVWVDSIPVYNHDGNRVMMRYDIRSNIYQSVDQLYRGNSVG